MEMQATTTLLRAKALLLVWEGLLIRSLHLTPLNQPAHGLGRAGTGIADMQWGQLVRPFLNYSYVATVCREHATKCCAYPAAAGVVLG